MPNNHSKYHTRDSRLARAAPVRLAVPDLASADGGPGVETAQSLLGEAFALDLGGGQEGFRGLGGGAWGDPVQPYPPLGGLQPIRDRCACPSHHDIDDVEAIGERVIEGGPYPRGV